MRNEIAIAREPFPRYMIRILAAKSRLWSSKTIILRADISLRPASSNEDPEIIRTDDYFETRRGVQGRTILRCGSGAKPIVATGILRIRSLWCRHSLTVGEGGNLIGPEIESAHTELRHLDRPALKVSGREATLW